MRPYISKSRMDRMEEVLSERCLDVMFLYENPVNPSNVYACLRTMDAFGIQNCMIVDGRYQKLIETSGDKTGGEVRKKVRKGKHSAMGSDKWLTVEMFNTEGEGVDGVVNKLRREGYKIYATSLEGGKDIRDFEFQPFSGGVDHQGKGVDPSGKICVVFGNEESGVTEGMKEASDGLFYLPMCGFAESFNLSVATSLTLAYMQSAGVIKASKGKRWEVIRKDILTRWMIGSFPKRGMGELILEKEGIEVERRGG